MRILYFGDGEWATNSLLRLIQDGHELLGVVLRVSPTDPGLRLESEQLRLPIFQPQQVNDKEFVDQVMALKPDVNLSCSYNQILRRPILETAPLGFINFHAGKLPAYRGRNVINWAIINGEHEIGITAHYIDEGIDTGDIILQRTLPIAWTDTYGDVLKNVVEAFPGLVGDSVNAVATGNIMRQPQSQNLGTYFPGRENGDEWLDWSDRSLNIYNKIRAISRPGPGAITRLESQDIIIWSADYDVAWPQYLATPGQVVGRLAGKGALVKTGDSTILIREIGTGKAESQVANWPLGTRLGINFQAELASTMAKVDRLEQEIARLKGNQR